MRRPVLPFLTGLLLFAPLVSPARSAALLTPPARAADSDALAAAAPGAAREPLPGGFVVVVPSGARAAPLTEARYKWQFPNALFLYGPAEGRQPVGLVRRVTIHHGPENADVARRTARLLARLLRLHEERFERPATFPRAAPEADVWLTRHAPAGKWPPPGGESRDNQIYIFDTNAPRTRIEWVRTIAHEWGHLTLPAARAFWEPENDASGFLGERLYIKWLREETRAGKTPPSDDWTDDAGLDLYHTRQIAPLIARFQAQGPDAPDWDRADGRAMDLYIGAALATDEALGSQLLGRGLFTALDVRPRALLTALREAAAGSEVLPVRLPAWVPLRQAAYEVAAKESASGAVAIADRPPLALPPEGRVRLDVRLSGWKWIRATSGSVAGITLRPLGGARSTRR